MKTAIINGRMITDGKILPRHTLLMAGGKITAVLPEQETPGDCAFIDAQGGYVSAGFLDLHTHGIGGYDFMDAEADAIPAALMAYARHGVTGVYPTTVSAPYPAIRRALDSLTAAYNAAPKGAQILGVHLEGPYFALSQRGAQPPETFSDPTDGEYLRLLQDYPIIARIDAAPELPDGVKMAKDLLRQGVLCGIAHTDADAATILRAAEEGYCIATHLYSGMSGVHRKDGYRIAGAVEACLLRDDLWCEAICDGIHLPKELLQLIYKIKGPERMIPVTDSMRGAGLPEGSRCMLGNRETGTEALVANGVAWLPDRSAFAGSVATFDRLIRTLTGLAEIPLPQAVQMATESPARAMGLVRKGRLASGYDADLVIFDDHINILRTVINGKSVYTKE